MSKKITIGVFGHYGNENLGDEAIIEAVIQNFKQRISNVNIVCFSVNPEDSASRYDVPAFPIRKNSGRKITHAAEVENYLSRKHNHAVTDSAKTDSHDNRQSGAKALLRKIPFLWTVLRSASRIPGYLKELWSELKFLWQSKKALADVDLLVIAGSNQFLDNFGGPWGFPYTLLKWSVLARLSSTKLAYMSVGAGPLDARLSRFLCRTALLFAHYYSYRDAASKVLIESGGLRNNGLVYPDLAQSIDLTKIKKSEVTSIGGKPRVGINLMPMYDSRYWCEADQSKYHTYIDKMADFAARLIEESYSVFLYATQPKDELALHDLVAALKQRGTKLEHEAEMIAHTRTVYELMDLLGGADILVPTRFHGVVLSLLSGKPTLGICYYRKSADLLNEMGQKEYAVELDDFNVDDLYQKFKLLEENYSNEQQKIKQQSQEHSEALAAQYDFVIRKLL